MSQINQDEAFQHPLTQSYSNEQDKMMVVCDTILTTKLASQNEENAEIEKETYMSLSYMV